MKKLARIFAPISFLTMGLTLRQMGCEFTDPKPGEVTTQVMTYPFAVVKTSLKELPDKVVLKKEYKN